MKKEKSDATLIEKTANYFDIPIDVVAGVPRMTITGGRRLFVENHKGLLEYGPEMIAINGERVIIRVRGSGLELKIMTDDELLVTGLIISLDFEF